MTIFYPDVSNYNSGLPIQTGTVAVCAKASEGHTFSDPLFPYFRAQATGVGALFFAYHWLHHNDPDGQAAWCYSIAGKTPVMIDCEDKTDLPTVADCLTFAAGLRARGGVCTLVYLPHWYWELIGSPDLRPLTAAGLALVSSNYTTYSDSGPGWAAYGGVNPTIWQYTDALPYAGRAVDFNAYRGTVAELAALIGGTMTSPTSPDPYAPYGAPAVVGNRPPGVLDIDMWSQEQLGASAYDGAKSFRTQQLQRIEDGVKSLAAAPPAQITMTAADHKAIADLVVADIKADLAALIATPTPPTT